MTVVQKNQRIRVQTIHQNPSRTQQQFADDANIHRILERYADTGSLDNQDKNRVPKYGDFSQIPDYQEAQNTVITAKTAFMRLPSKIRDRFDHDPQKLISFINDPNNLREAIELGIMPAPLEEQINKKQAENQPKTKKSKDLEVE